MRFQQYRHQPNSLRNRYVRQSNQPRVLLVVKEHERSKVGVDGHKHTSLCGRPLKQRFVSWVFTHLTDVACIMPLSTKPIGQPAAGTAVDEEFHSLRHGNRRKRIARHNCVPVGNAGSNIAELKLGIVL